MQLGGGIPFLSLRSRRLTICNIYLSIRALSIIYLYILLGMEISNIAMLKISNIGFSQH